MLICDSRQRAIQKSVQYGFVTLCHLFGCDVSCVTHSLLLCVSLTCTVRWALLCHVVGIDKTSKRSLFNFRVLSEGRKHFSASTVYNAFRPVCHTVVALYFGSDFANLEVLHDSCAVEWDERVILLQDASRFGCVSN